jgi:hypothetical protein
MPDTGQTNECRSGQRARLALGNKPLTPEEHAMKQQLESEAALYKLYTAAYDTLARESATYPHLYSLVHIFDQYESLMWIDDGHVTPVGNHVIAERIVDIIQARAPDAMQSTISCSHAVQKLPGCPPSER